MPILEEQGPDETLFQQDRALPQFHKEVTDFLNSKISEIYIGRGMPITWPPNSFDLTPLISSFWGDATIGHHFAGPCWEDKRCSGYSYSA
jgi:hypothetical protein